MFHIHSQEYCIVILISSITMEKKLLSTFCAFCLVKFEILINIGQSFVVFIFNKNLKMKKMFYNVSFIYVTCCCSVLYLCVVFM